MGTLQCPRIFARMLPNQKNWFFDLDPDAGSRFFDSIERYFYTKG